MLRNNRHIVWIPALLLIASTALVLGANFDKSLRDTEGRRRAAENGLRQIKVKSPQQADQIRAVYADAATEHNAWLDVVTEAVRQSAATPPDVTSAAERASTSLVTWVAARNRALGEPELAGAIADSVKRGATQDLTDIAAQVWKDNRRTDEKKRTAAITALSDRLKWKSWEDIQ